MSREHQVSRLKEVLPYRDTWYKTLTDCQIYVLYQKYLVNKIKIPKVKIPKVAFPQIIFEEATYEEDKSAGKVLIKRRVFEGQKQVLTDAGNWEEEYD